jgi:hypothetical protein
MGAATCWAQQQVPHINTTGRVKYADQKSFADAAQWVFTEHAELMRKLGE